MRLYARSDCANSLTSKSHSANATAPYDAQLDDANPFSVVWSRGILCKAREGRISAGPGTTDENGFLSVLLAIKKRQVGKISLQSVESMHAVDTRKVIGAITISMGRAVIGERGRR